MDEVLHQCEPYAPELLTEKTLTISEDFSEFLEYMRVFSSSERTRNLTSQKLQKDFEFLLRLFDARVQFNANFQHQDYQAFSVIGVSFIGNTAVEVAISLGAPRDIERFSSEDVVTDIFSSFLEELYGNGRYYEDEAGGRVHAWKINSDTLLAFFSHLDSVDESAGSWLGINICDVKLHPIGRVLEQHYEEGVKL